MKTVAVFIDMLPGSMPEIDAAIALAASSNAHLVGILVEVPVNIALGPGAATTFARGAGIDDVIGRELEMRRRLEDDVRARFASAGRTFGIDVEIRTLGVDANGLAAVLHARYSDIAVLAAAQHPQRRKIWSSTDLIFGSGVPTMLVPASFHKGDLGKHVVVGWNASRVARRAVADAMPILRRADLVSVVVIDPVVSVTAHGEGPGSDIATMLARAGVRAQVVRIDAHHADPAHRLIDFARSEKADLIVAGAYGHSRVVELVLGSSTKTLIHESSIPIMFSH